MHRGPRHMAPHLRTLTRDSATNPGGLLGILPVAGAGWRTDNSRLSGHRLGALPSQTGQTCVMGAIGPGDRWALQLTAKVSNCRYE